MSIKEWEQEKRRRNYTLIFSSKNLESTDRVYQEFKNKFNRIEEIENITIDIKVEYYENRGE